MFQKYFCQFVTTLKRHKFMCFKLSNLPTYPTLLMLHDTSNLSPDRAEPRLIKENDSICLCRLGRFGARCYLRHTLCDSNPCLNNGQCLPWDPSLVTASQKNAICICPPGYMGAHSIPPSILIHLITFPPGSIGLELNRMSIMKKLAFDQDSLVLNTSFSFNLTLMQISTNYYLIILQEHGTVSGHISTQIVPSNRCHSINEIFNETFATQHILKRIKRYRIPCEQSINLM
ncbi:unnamed protein product [Rotaria magnacalcarata]|uniref:EGF-like domain-containing protein n=1 Tax=Rotaria magnacalcarata TaxID=392030 RepID=A0A8S3ANX3_9BILA|nr:unnamed protein product [Rotaria magnacalcarata]